MKTKSKVLMMMGLATAASFSSSCINPDYDLSQGIDTEVTILPNKTIPVGDCTPIMLEDLLGEQVGGTSVLQKSPKGDLFLQVSSDPITQKIAIPEVIFEEKNTHAENTIQLPTFTLPVLPPADLIVPPEGIPIDVAEVTFNINIDQNTVPTELTAIEYAEISSKLAINLRYDNVALEHIYIKAGTRINLPSCIVFDSIPDEMELDPQTNDLILKNEKVVNKGQGLNIAVGIKGIDFTKMPEGQGLVSPGRFVMKDVVSLDMMVYTKGSDVKNTGTFSPRIIITTDIDPFSFKSITGKVQVDTDIQVDPVRISGLPEFLPSGTTVDLKGLRVNLAAESSFPIGGSFKATLQPVIGGVDGRPEEALTPVTIGPLNLNKAAENSTSRTAISLSAKGEGAPEGYENVKTESLDELVKRIPDQFRIIDPEFKIADEVCTVKMGTNGKDQEYGVTLDYEVVAPLAFGPDMDFSMNQDLDLAMDLTQAGINTVSLDMIAVNTLPIDFKVSAEVLDNNGNPSTDVQIEGGVELKGGSLEQPVENLLSLTLKSEKPLVLNKVRLIMKANGNAQNTLPLNTNQYLELKKLHLTLPEGITQTLSK